jgi:hypothetical protein
MPSFDVDREEILVFPIDEEYLFTHYFERTDVFEDLSDYYNGDAYRFEVPADEYESVAERLREAYYEPVVVEDYEPYCVVIEKYSEHADILRQSVLNWERRGHRFFLLKSELAVKEALEQGATKLEETDMVLGL